MKKKLFLQWLVIAMLIGTALAVGAKLDLQTALATQDRSRISFGIVALGIFATLACGRLAWRADGLIERRDGNGHALARLYAGIKHQEFAAKLCQYLGLLGTVAGLKMALATFSSTGEATQSAIQGMTFDMSTALITTGVGIIASAVIWLQYHIVQTALEIEEARDAEE